MLNINDVINVVRFPLDDEVDDGRQDQSADGIFQRYGVMEDGIDLVFDANDGVLQVVVRYQKMVVTKESMPFLTAVGVLFRGDDYEFHPGNNINSAATPDTSTCISTGMEFMDRGYLMRVKAGANDVVYARRTYKLVGHRSVRVYGCDNDHIVTYTDIADINNRIQEMLADE